MAELFLDFELPTTLPATLPVLPLRQGLLLPGVVSPFSVGRAQSLAALDAANGGLLLVAVQREPIADPTPADFLPIATLARVVQPLSNKPGVRAVAVQGLRRVRLVDVKASAALENAPSDPHLVAGFELIEDSWPDTPEAEGVRRALLSGIEGLADLLDADAPVRAMVKGIENPAVLVDLTAAFIESKAEFKRDVLLTLDPIKRAEKVLRQISLTTEVLAAQRSIESRVISDVRGNEREAILRRQLRAIQEELGEKEGEADELGRLKLRLEALELPEEVRGTVDRELKRLSRINGMSPERNVGIDWLEWIADLPWSESVASELDLTALESELDRTHFGLSDVKKQVVEHLAVRKLAGKGRADVLLLVGPPGVGKTSIAQAIADASQRKLVRVALGGVRDEAELRGHRRTYVGARPGRVVEGIRRAGTAEAVVLFDEVDKMGRGYQGDPAAALLEILDPEQNHAFVDHYLEVPFDLSRMLFVATANDLSAVPPALRDRMEVLEIEGYSQDEKVRIARAHVLSKLAENAGVETSDVVITDDAIEDAIAGWTREAGVRQLQRVLGKVFRSAAVKKARAELGGPLEVTKDNLVEYLGRRRFHEEQHEVMSRAGIATGLAWTPMGGDVLYVEASAVLGSGRLVLTGQLGDVMKESAQAALTYVRAHVVELGIEDFDFAKQDIHLHVPAGATPKDGPSAGVTMFSAIASLLTGRRVGDDVAMTGEVTLRGRVLPVGGIKSKVLAAYARGLRRVILPKRNVEDLEDLPKAVREAMSFLPVTSLDEVLAAALGVLAEPGSAGRGAPAPAPANEPDVHTHHAA